MMSHEEPVWAKEIPAGDFLSYAPSYTAGNYFNLFSKGILKNDSVGDISYYFYDPIAHGEAANKKYPLLMFLHGFGNSFDGEIVINYSMAELYASPAYQKTIGGAYILVPVANERKDLQGNIENSWNEKYCQPLMELKKNFDETQGHNISKTFIFGTSKGGFMLWNLLKNYSQEIDVAVSISGGDFPDEEKLKEIQDNGTLILSMHGKHDELIPYQEYVLPHLEKLRKFSNIILWHPEWIRNGDGGIAQLNPGIEMGQHCLCNQVQANLMFDNGKPYDQKLFPEGMTGWIRDHI